MSRRVPGFADVHPLQAPETMQGTLEILYRFNRIMCRIAGMDAFTFQPASGAQGIYTNACLIRAYHEARGEGGKRDEIITTAFSHPADAATPAVAGFKVITLMPGEMGFAEVDALKAAVSDRTAGLMLTNPEDTGQYNPHIREFVDIVHEAGGLCAYDQANGNPLLGIVRAGRHRLRHVPVQPAQDLLRAPRFHRPRLRRGRRQGASGALSAAPDRHL